MLLLHLGCGQQRLAGFENLDPKINGWTFESGLPFNSETVDGITISHALMYVEEKDWAKVFSEFFRVLKPGGVVRITEDDTESPASPRHVNPWPGFKALTGPGMTYGAFTDAGFETHIVGPDETYFSSAALLLKNREEKRPRYFFYMEGVKPC